MFGSSNDHPHSRYSIKCIELYLQGTNVKMSFGSQDEITCIGLRNLIDMNVEISNICLTFLKHSDKLQKLVFTLTLLTADSLIYKFMYLQIVSYFIV